MWRLTFKLDCCWLSDDASACYCKCTRDFHVLIKKFCFHIAMLNVKFCYFFCLFCIWINWNCHLNTFEACRSWMEWIGKWCDLVGAFCKQIKNNFRKFWNFVLNFEFKEFLWVFWTVFIDFSVKTEENELIFLAIFFWQKLA